MPAVVILLLVVVPVTTVAFAVVRMNQQRLNSKAELAKLEIRKLEAQAELLRSASGLPSHIDRGDPAAVEAWNQARREVEAMERSL